MATANQDSVTVSIVGGPSVSVPWTAGMNAQVALEKTYDALKGGKSEFSYAVQFYGAQLGYLVSMINETYESFPSSPERTAYPFYFWEFLVNGKPAQQGIDGTKLAAGDEVTFELQSYSAQAHADSTLSAKFAARTKSFK